MDVAEVERIAKAQMESRKDLKAREPGWLYYHGLRTAKISLELAELVGVEINHGVLYAGALFHDIGKGEEPHNVRGAELTGKLLASCFSKSELATVCQIIELHNQRKNSKNQSLAVQLVQDADLIDHVGPVVPWLAFYWSGTHGETVQDHVRFVTGEENEQYRRGMREQLNFEVSLRMFDERMRWEDEYFRNFRKVYFEGIWHITTKESDEGIRGCPSTVFHGKNQKILLSSTTMF
jgi:uncharacterized protein